MGKTIVIDEHTYREREDGLYQVDEPYEVTSDWMDKEEHKNMAVIVIVRESRDYACIVCTNTSGFDNINKVNKVAADMRKSNPIVEVMWALTDDDDLLCIGGLDRVEEQ